MVIFFYSYRDKKKYFRRRFKCNHMRKYLCLRNKIWNQKSGVFYHWISIFFCTRNVFFFLLCFPELNSVEWMITKSAISFLLFLFFVMASRVFEALLFKLYVLSSNKWDIQLKLQSSTFSFSPAGSFSNTVRANVLRIFEKKKITFG